MMSQRISGLLQVKVDGVMYDAKGDWDYSLGKPKREAVVGSNGVQGYKETPQVPFVEGKFTDRGTLDLAALAGIDNATVILELANGKTIVLRSAWYAGEGKVSTGEAEIDARFEGLDGEEIGA
jgi:hypothetical protein